MNDTMVMHDLQARLKEWNETNFKSPADTVLATKLLEETGEAAHAILRLHLRDQLSKSVNPKSEAKLRDALGDVIVVLMHLANNHGWSLLDVFQEVAEEVLARDYSKRA